MLAVLELPNGFWLGVVSHLWQTTLVLAVLAALALAMRRAPARLLNGLWWIGLAKLLLPVQLLTPTLERALAPVLSRTNAAGLTLDGITVWLEKAAPIVDPVAAARGDLTALNAIGATGAVLALLWAAGAVWFGLAWFRSARRPRPEPLDPDRLRSDLRQSLDRALAGTRVPRAALVVVAYPVMPAVVGVFRRRILLPVAVLSRLDAAGLRAVLLHEDAHRRRFEPLRSGIQRAAVVAFYFFPPLWPLLRRLRSTSEMACDEAAVRGGVSPSDYARALARTMSIGLEPLGIAAAFAHGGPSLTRQRFERLRQEGRFVPMRKHWFCLALAAVCLVAVSVSPLTTLATADDERDAERSEEATEEAPKELEVTEEKTYTITLKSTANPEYPDDAKKAGADGEVVLELTVTPDGEVWSIEVLEGSESFPTFDEAAVDAASQWTFELEGVGDDNVEVVVPVHFRMDDHKTMEMSVTIPDATPAEGDPQPVPKPADSGMPDEEAAPEPPRAPDEPAESEPPDASPPPEAPDEPDTD